MTRRFNIVSETGDGMGFAYRLKQEGEEVRLWIRNADAKEVGDGMVEKVGDMEDMVHGATEEDIFLFDVSGNGVIADGLRSQGFKVLGGSVLADRLERDRKFGNSVMEQSGINTPATTSFDNFDDGIEFARESPERLVYKPSKTLGDLSPSHVSHDNEELVEILETIKNEVSIEKPQFELQEFKEGVALSTEMWFDGTRFVESMWNHTLERKELMNENLGPSGGCTGNIVWACGNCPVCQECRSLSPWLRANAYRGMLDLNSIVSEEGVFGLEWTPRFGYDASPTLFWELLDQSLGDFLAGAASDNYLDARLLSGFGAAVRVTIPPWPTEKYHAESGLPIRGLDREEMASLYWYNTKLESGDFKTAGAWGIIALLTGRGESVGRAFSRPYRLAPDFSVKNRQYRTDLREQFKSDLSKLEEVMDGIFENVG